MEILKYNFVYFVYFVLLLFSLLLSLFVVFVVSVSFLFVVCVEGRGEVAANPSPHAIFRKTHQNRGPTASGVGNSESTQKTV